MVKIYENQRLIHATHTNAQLRLDAYGVMRLLQDVTAEHSVDLGIDYESMLEKSNAFWVMTKIRIHFDQAPRMFEQALIRTWPLAAQHVCCERCYTVTTPEGGKICARSEWVLLDAQTHAIRRPESTCYPMDFVFCTEKVLEAPFLRMRPVFTQDDLYMHRQIFPTDLDMSRHTNNTQYARFILDCFPLEFFDENEMMDMEIHFIRESHAGEILVIYKKQLSAGEYRLAGLDDVGKPVFTACIQVCPVKDTQC